MSIIVLPTEKRKRNNDRLARTRTITGFLRATTSRLVYGRKFYGTPKPVLTKSQLTDRFNERGYGITPPVEVFQRHQESKDTLYYFGSDDPRDSHTLVMLDIDVNKANGLGSTEGAKRLAEHYKTLFPLSYWETSTNGNGQHGYVLVEKDGFTASAVKDGLKRLETYLRHEAEGHDVELVEVKGAPPVVRWAGRQIDAITYGTFAKLPRHATLDELKNLPVVPLADLIGDN